MSADIVVIENEDTLKSAAVALSKTLLEGNIAIFPTGTLYGIGALLSNFDAVIRINNIKERYSKANQIVLVDFMWLPDIVIGLDRYLPLLEILWPGPFSVVLPTRLKHPFAVKNLAIRVSDSSFIELILRETKEPITSTSANKDEENPIGHLDGLLTTFGESVDTIAFWQPIPDDALPSTMIDATKFPDEIRILRAGVSDLSEIGLFFPDTNIVHTEGNIREIWKRYTSEKEKGV